MKTILRLESQANWSNSEPVAWRAAPRVLPVLTIDLESRVALVIVWPMLGVTGLVNCQVSVQDNVKQTVSEAHHERVPGDGRGNTYHISMLPASNEALKPTDSRQLPLRANY